MLIMVNMVMILSVQEHQQSYLEVNAIMGLTSEKPDINYEDDGGYFHISVDTNNKEALNSSSNVSFFTNYRRRI